MAITIKLLFVGLYLTNFLTNCSKHVVNYKKSHCPSPPQISNAFVDAKFYNNSGSSTSVMVYYTCAHGFEMKGDNRLFCFKVTLSHYVWSIPTFTCLPTTCKPPQDLLNGHVVGADYAVGKQISFQCNTGFHMYAPNGTFLDVAPFQVCQVVSGVWVGERPICVDEKTHKMIVDKTQRRLLSARSMKKSVKSAVNTHRNRCNQPPEVENSFFDEETLKMNKTEGVTVEYKCLSGFEMAGQGYVTCKKIKDGDMLWTEPKFICLPTRCPTPKAPEGGHLIGQGKNISFECRKPRVMYSSDGKSRISTSPQITCSSNGTWIGEKPLCLALMCPLPVNITDGYIEIDSRIPGSQITYKCAIGFVRLGNYERICMTSGEWSGHSPICQSARSLQLNYDDVNELIDAENGIENDEEMSFLERAWHDLKAWIEKIGEQFGQTYSSI